MYEELATCDAGFYCMFRAALLALSFFFPAAAAGQGDPFAPLQPERLSRDELRLVQSGLALGGHYLGRLDGAWGSRSQRGLAAQRREMGWPDGRPDWEDAVLAALRAVDEFDLGGWGVRDIPAANLSYIMPYGLLQEERGASHPTAQTRDRALLIREIVDGVAATWDMHNWLERVHAGREAFYRARPGGAIVSSGTLSNGKTVYLRTHAIDRRTLLTVLVQWDRSENPRARLITASFTIGGQTFPQWGPTLRRASEAVIAARAAPPAPPQTPRAEPPRAASRSAPPTSLGTGSGFFVNPTTVVTNAHVVEGCEVLTTAQGTPLILLASDAHRDLALLFATEASEHWLELAIDAPKLGEPVWALGFPFGGDYHSGLSVTSGILSATAGRISAGPHMMISAPVQPGNSGGPVLGADGRVIGIVVMRLNDRVTEDERGFLPQNMNFAVPVNELHAFLSERRIAPLGASAATPLEGLDDEAISANVHVLCYR